jgi:hypothetical protein
VGAGADRFITNNKRDFPPTITEIQVTYPADLADSADGDFSTVKGMLDRKRSVTWRARTPPGATSRSALTSRAASPTPQQPPAK